MGVYIVNQRTRVLYKTDKPDFFLPKQENLLDKINIELWTKLSENNVKEVR